MASGEARAEGRGLRAEGGDIEEVLYIGFGRFLAGVPARDMTAEEWAELPEEARALGVSLDLYQVVTEDQGRRAGSGRRRAAGGKPKADGGDTAEDVVVSEAGDQEGEA